MNQNKWAMVKKDCPSRMTQHKWNGEKTGKSLCAAKAIDDEIWSKTECKFQKKCPMLYWAKVSYLGGL